MGTTGDAHTEGKALIERVSGHDGEALRLLVRRYRPFVFRTATTILNDPDEAEDITQETFIRIWKNARRYDGRYKPSTWIYRITYNLCMDSIRKRKLLLPLSLAKKPWHELRSEKGDTAADLSSEDRMIAREEWEMYRKAVEALSPKQRSALVLRDIEELETDEVTKITGMTADQIKSNLYHARKAIKQYLHENREK